MLLTLLLFVVLQFGRYLVQKVVNFVVHFRWMNCLHACVQTDWEDQTLCVRYIGRGAAAAAY